jgi:hypothetical protein
MSASLQARARKFLARPIPKGMAYVPDSLSERLIRSYAAGGEDEVDAELAELLDICIFEATDAAENKTGEEAAYFRECAEILQAIQAELHG